MHTHTHTHAHTLTHSRTHTLTHTHTRTHTHNSTQVCHQITFVTGLTKQKISIPFVLNTGRQLKTLACQYVVCNAPVHLSVSVQCGHTWSVHFWDLELCSLLLALHTFMDYLKYSSRTKHEVLQYIHTPHILYVHSIYVHSTYTYVQDHHIILLLGLAIKQYLPCMALCKLNFEEFVDLTKFFLHTHRH